MWGASFCRMDIFYQSLGWILVSGRGQALVYVQHYYDVLPSPKWEHVSLEPEVPPVRLLDTREWPGTEWRVLSVRCHYSNMIPQGGRTSVGWEADIAIPYWIAFVGFSLLPGAWVLRRLLKRSAPPTLCTTCGYDLRATPDRCPECGTAVAGESVEAK